MNDWTAGYVADVGYTYGYYAELNPLRIKLAFLNSGLQYPEVGNACELGIGQGLSTNIHAAASTVKWYGDDFNPSQASFAQELANASQNQAVLSDESFAEFALREDLPEFDYIGLHGIWSWISDDNRSVIVDFIRRKLKLGGVLYISYNTQPGWAAMIPMRDLLTEHSNVMGAPGQGIVNRIGGALDFADKLFATKPLYALANTTVAERFKKIQGQNRHYLAHEYFNQDWLPMSFSKMANWLSSAKLTYACSAHYLEQIDEINLTAEQRGFINEIPDESFKQTVRDLMVNQQFRKDYWVKGARRLTPLEQYEQLRTLKFVLIQPRGEVALKVAGALGEVLMQELIYGPILDYLADHQIKTLGQIEQAVREKGITFSQITQALLILTATGIIGSAQENIVIDKVKKVTDKLNNVLMTKSRSSNELGYLASPVTGGGFPVNRFEQMFLLAIIQGKKKTDEWAHFTWGLLSTQGQRLAKEGRTLEMPEENLTELSKQAEVFAEKKLPILKALQVI